MHEGVFKGANIGNEKRILVLGESHYRSSNDTSDFTTASVLNNYFQYPSIRAYKFFDKIAACCGYNADERETFWNKVWFGNYVDESDCGIRTDRATNLIKEFKGRYNKELFEFVNENRIEIILCFSRLVYNHLPKQTSFEDKSSVIEVSQTGGKRDWIGKSIYKAGAREHDEIILDNELTVFGFRHPSAACGFSTENYRNQLQKEICLQFLLKNER